MRINFVNQGMTGSTFYRMVLPARALRANGIDAELVQAGEDVRDADVWVIGRPTTHKDVEVIQGLLDHRKRVVVDFDDRFDCIRPGHVMYGQPAETAHQYALQACKIASAVTCSTPGVAAAYGGTVVPNYIPAAYLAITGRHIGELKVMWSGTISSHPNDLQSTKGQVARAVRETPNAAVAYVGPKEDERLIANALKYRAPILTAGWFRLADYPKAIAEADVGIVPLEDCGFNSCKSYLKMAEFSAVGVPCVVSPTVENKILLDIGIGLEAKYPRDWYRKVSALLNSADYRAEIAGKSREGMAAFTVEGNIDRWIDALI